VVEGGYRSRAIAHIFAVVQPIGHRPRTITVETTLDAPAERVWRAMLLPATFLHVCRGLFRVPALEGRIDPLVEGETGSGRLWVFGVVPAYRHTIHVTGVDEASGTITTHEHGGVLRAWDHTLHVEPAGPARSRYRDTVAVDAGWLTGLVAATAVGIYRYRQRRWRALARDHLAP
jgi:ligand-binding SRPBCC domain-containing protein